MTNARQDQKAPRRKRKWLWRLVVVVVLLLVLLPLTLFFLRHRIAEHLIHSMIRRVESSTGGSLVVGQADLDLLHLSAVLQDVRLEIPSPTGPPMVAEFRSGSASFSLGDLLQLPAGRFSVRSLELTAPDIRLQRSFLARPGREEGNDLVMDLRIGALKVRDGRFRYEGRDLPLAVDIRNLSLAAKWDDSARSLDGSVAFRSELSGAPFRLPISLDLSSRFRQHGTRVELSGLVAEAPMGRVEMEDALVSWDDGVRITGAGSVEGDLAMLGDLLTEGMPELAGEVAGDLRLEYEGGELRFHSRVQGYGVQVGPVRTDRIAADATIDLDTLTLDRLEGTAFGGAVTGSVQVPWNLDRELRMDVAGAGLDAARLFRLLELPLPFAASSDVTFRFIGSWPDRSTWNGSGKAVLRRRSREGLLPVEAAGEFGIRSGVLQVDAPRVVTSGAVLSVTMDADLVRGRSSAGQFLRLLGETEDAGLTRAGAIRILERFDTDLPGTLMEALSGSGDIQAEIGLTDQAFLDMTLDLSDGVWGPDSYRRLSFRTLLEGDRVRIRDLTVVSEDWDLAGSLELDLAGDEIRAADLTSRNFPLSRGMKLAGIEGDVTGRLSGRFHLRGGDGGLGGDGEFTLGDTVIAGFPTGILEGSVRAVDGLFRIEGMTVNGPGLTGKLDIAYDLDGGAAEIRIVEARVSPGLLPVWDGAAAPFHAPSDFHGTVLYDGQALQGTVQVEGSGWDLAGHRLPDLTGTVTLDTDGAEIGWRSAEDDSLDGSARILWDRYSLSMRLSAVDYRIGFGDPGGGTPLWTRVTGTAALEGSLAEPDSITVRGSLDRMELRLGAHRLELQHPVPVVMDRERIEAGPVILGSEGSNLTGRFTLERADGRIAMDWNGEVSLAALAAPLPDLRARGDMEVDLKLRGTLNDPDLTGLVRFRDGWVRLIGFPQPLEHVRGTIRFANDEAELFDFSSRFGGGEISGEGKRSHRDKN